MIRHASLFACLTLTAGLAAAADAPPAPPAAVAPGASTASAAPAATPATAAAPVPTAAPAATPNRVYAGGLTNPEIEHAFRQFSRRVVGDEVRYCRRESPLGTRLPKTVCYSAEQVLEMARAEREAGEEVARKRSQSR